MLLWAICIYAILSSMSVREVFIDLKTDIVPGAIEMTTMKYTATDIRMWTLTHIIRGDYERGGNTLKDWLKTQWTTLENDAKKHYEHQKYI